MRTLFLTAVFIELIIPWLKIFSTYFSVATDSENLSVGGRILQVFLDLKSSDFPKLRGKNGKQN